MTIQTKGAAAIDMLYFQVRTPSVFREVRLPADADERSAKERTALRGLRMLAEQHGTHVTSSSYRQG